MSMAGFVHPQKECVFRSVVAVNPRCRDQFGTRRDAPARVIAIWHGGGFSAVLAIGSFVLFAFAEVQRLVAFDF